MMEKLEGYNQPIGSIEKIEDDLKPFNDACNNLPDDPIADITQFIQAVKAALDSYPGGLSDKVRAIIKEARKEGKEELEERTKIVQQQISNKPLLGDLLKLSMHYKKNLRYFNSENKLKRIGREVLGLLGGGRSRQLTMDQLEMAENINNLLLRIKGNAGPQDAELPDSGDAHP